MNRQANEPAVGQNDMPSPTRTCRQAASWLGDSGQAMVEFAIVFPIQLLLTFGIIQIAFLYVARQTTQYAAYCATRSVLTGDPTLDNLEGDAHRAASIVCTGIAGSRSRATGMWQGTLRIPPVGRLRNDSQALLKTRVQLEQRAVREGIAVILPYPGPRVAREEIISVAVFHDFEMAVPVAGQIMSVSRTRFGIIPGVIRRDDQEIERVDLWIRYGAPHVRVGERCTLPKPWQ